MLNSELALCAAFLVLVEDDTVVASTLPACLIVDALQS